VAGGLGAAPAADPWGAGLGTAGVRSGVRVGVGLGLARGRALSDPGVGVALALAAGTGAGVRRGIWGGKSGRAGGRDCAGSGR